VHIFTLSHLLTKENIDIMKTENNRFEIVLNLNFYLKIRTKLRAKFMRKQIIFVFVMLLIFIIGLFSLWQFGLYQRFSKEALSCGGDWSYNVQCPIGSYCQSMGQGPLVGGLCKPILSSLFNIFAKPESGNKRKTVGTIVPSDFSLEYQFGACHAEWGRTNLKVDNNGNVNVESTQGFFREEKQYSLSKDELTSIYQAFLKNNFFSLESEYRNTGIIDGGCSSLELKADDKTHKVSMVNQTPNQITKITKILLQIMELKDKNWQQIDRKQICTKAKVACIGTKEYNGIPCEVWNSQCKSQ